VAGDICSGTRYGGMDFERLSVTGQGKQSQHLPLRRRQHHIAAAAPGNPLHPQQGGQRAAVDEAKH
jgi:hypothetical protein